MAKSTFFANNCTLRKGAIAHLHDKICAAILRLISKTNSPQ
jgi:hypothetical protein